MKRFKNRSFCAIFFCIHLLCILTTLLVNAHELEHHLVGWYPTEPTALTTKLTELDHSAQKHYNAPADARIRALIVPHAGYTYSGSIAAAGYRLLDSSAYDTVILICPAHTSLFNGIALSTAKNYRLPLGNITIAQPVIKKLVHKDPFIYNDQAFVREHAIEIQLPLLQHYLKKFTLIPMVIGAVTDEQLEQAAQKLKSCITKKTLLVISSDFTHYGARFNYTPFIDQQALRIKQLDNQALMAIQQGDPHEFSAFINETGTTICGQRAIILLLNLIKQDAFSTVEPRVIAYAQSAALHDNTGESVSYAALTFTNQKLEELPANKQFNQFERTELITSARGTLENLFQKRVAESLRAPIETQALKTTRGAFVTLITKPAHELRGCIGNIIGYQPLTQTIARLTQAAALHDTRFNPVNAQEIPSISLEISILTPPKKIKSTKEIILGTHGIILHHNEHQAVYLPEVATEQNWNLQTTLGSLSQKAGLPATAWQDTDAWFEVFESIKFGEK